MLNARGDHLVHREEDLVVIRRDTDVTALAVRYPEEVTRSVPASFGTRVAADRTLATWQPKTLSLCIAGLVAGKCYSLEAVDDLDTDRVVDARLATGVLVGRQ
ncbi:hypothetical protein [Streptomyces sp. NPDC127036]|uniref:hypothetical protein n=1 Tax=Streptomyces sp. NPDC127036 TaxID=3347112 RepID=UPI00364C6ECC